jgi:uncharacterized protein (DUF1501 family)
MTTTSTETACRGCADEARARTLTRRSLLRALGLGAAGTAGAGALGLTNARVAWASGPWTGDTLVVLSLRGGFDGLNAVVPLGDAAYPVLRPTIGVTAAQAVKLDAMFGLHPALAPVKPLWDAGHLAAVHAAGLPAPNRSHFDAMDELERAAPGSAVRTGWLDRVLALHDSSGPFTGVQLGSAEMPVALSGPVETLGMDRLSDFSLDGTDATSRPQWNAALTALHAEAGTSLKGSATTTLAALDSAAQFSTTYAPANGADYPGSGLGHTLADTARLIKSNLGARVITLDEGDWDMHAGLGTPGSGWQHDKLADLADSLVAFATDLGPALDGVTLITISEFGRRAHENESQGVDHGWGNVMFVLGGHVSAAVHGTWPGLADAALVNGDLRATTDYRAVLADVLANRCGADAASLTSVFPGYTGSTLGITTP